MHYSTSAEDLVEIHMVIKTLFDCKYIPVDKYLNGNLVSGFMNTWKNKFFWCIPNYIYDHTYVNSAYKQKKSRILFSNAYNVIHCVHAYIIILYVYTGRLVQLLYQWMPILGCAEGKQPVIVYTLHFLELKCSVTSQNHVEQC